MTARRACRISRRRYSPWRGPWGAKARVDISVDSLSAGDRDLARLVLNDLVGNALNAGAGAIDVALAPDGAQVAISVTDDAPPMATGVWKTPGTSSARWRLVWEASPDR